MDTRQLAKTLRLLAADEFAIATAAAINRVAHAAHSSSERNIRQEFTIRNKYTLGSMMFFKATPKKDADKINAITGSKSAYLDDQDVGGTAQTKQGKAATSMPSLASRRGSWGSSVTARYRADKRGAVGHRGAGGRMTPKGARYFWLSGGSLKTAIMFERRGKKLIRVRVQMRPVQLKATGWHRHAMDKFGRPGVMSAAWGQELQKGLAKLGAT